MHTKMDVAQCSPSGILRSIPEKNQQQPCECKSGVITMMPEMAWLYYSAFKKRLPNTEWSGAGTERLLLGKGPWWKRKGKGLEQIPIRGVWEGGLQASYPQPWGFILFTRLYLIEGNALEQWECKVKSTRGKGRSRPLNRAGLGMSNLKEAKLTYPIWTGTLCRADRMLC